MGASWKEMIVIFLLIIGLLWVKNSRSDVYVDYYNELVPYIIIDDNRILPEYTKFVCENNVLYKNKAPVRMYTGKVKRCQTVYIKRKDYGKKHDATNLF